MVLFVCYDKCSTCHKARTWLEEKGVAFTQRDVRQKRPTERELRQWVSRSGLPLRRFFNTSGLLYKALELKDRLPAMSEDEQFRLLAQDGMLVKRPILVTDKGVFPGFRPEEWEALL